MAAEEDRCPNCGALVVEGAEWCGQCYTPLKVSAQAEAEAETDAEAEAEAAAPTGTGSTSSEPDAHADGDIPPLPALTAESSSGAQAVAGEIVDTQTLGKEPATEAKSGATSWTCPSCDHKNPLDLDICAVCGTPFSRLFSEGEEDRHVDPERAALFSAVPGLGHWVVGQHGEAVTRFLFVVWGLGVGFLGLLAKTSTQYPGGAKLHPVGVVYILSALIVYGIGFIDAYRAASGHEQYLSVKILLYWFAAMIFIFLISVFGAFLSVTKTRINPGGGGPTTA